MTTLDTHKLWPELVQKHTNNGACNFQAAANELAEIVAAAEREACAARNPRKGIK